MLLLLHSFQYYSTKNHFNSIYNENNSFCTSYSDLDVLVIKLPREMNHGTSTCTIISLEIIMNNQILNVDFSSPISLDLQSLFKSQISQITSIFLVTSELFGLDGSVHGALLFIGTISIGTQKYQETKKEASRNRNRLVIKETIDENPGISLREILRTTNLAMGVVQYHIRYLESGEVGEIESLKLGRSKHFFVCSSSFSIKEKVWFSLNRNKNIKGILDLLGTSSSQCSQKDLSLITGNSKSLISYYIKILRLKGIIEVENYQLKISGEFTEINHKFLSEKTRLRFS